jgi:hypothetical protein
VVFMAGRAVSLKASRMPPPALACRWGSTYGFDECHGRVQAPPVLAAPTE